MSAELKAEIDISSVRAEMHRRLPELLACVISSYDLFLSAEAPMDAKGFATYHAAGKAALSHLETLTKIGAWADVASDQSVEEDVSLQWLGEAKAALALVSDADT